MAKETTRLDKFSNRTMFSMTMSAANTLTFEQIRFGVGVFEGIAIILNRVLFYPLSTTWRELAAVTDLMSVVLTNRDDLTTIDPTNLSILAHVQVTGMGASVEPQKSPIELDFRTNPGGGLLIPANPLYMGILTAGFAAAATVRAILEYQYKKLTPQENIELLQTLLPGST